MSNLLLTVLLVISVAASAQSFDRITFSKFDKPKDFALLDTVKSLLLTGNYSKFISGEKEVYPAKGGNNHFAAVNKLLNKLSRNGSDDISQCFYPRHSINFYKGGKLVKYVLICFECYGLRFSDERWITRVRDEKKRMALMDELKAYFTLEEF